MTSSEPVIEVRDLLFRWHAGGPVVLDMPEFTVRRGERLFIQGPSGSGKSTLLNLLGGVVTPDRGQLRILGQDLRGMRGAARDRLRADDIGFIFQLHNLLPYLSVLENVALPCRFSRRRRERALSRSATVEAEAKRLLRHLDLDDPELLQRPVTALSVGQQQRAAAARALIGAPQIIIADEPTSALDAHRREAFLQLLSQECAAQQSTLLMVSHDPALRVLFDRTVALPELNRAAPAEAACV